MHRDDQENTADGRRGGTLMQDTVPTAPYLNSPAADPAQRAFRVPCPHNQRGRAEPTRQRCQHPVNTGSSC